MAVATMTPQSSHGSSDSMGGDSLVFLTASADADEGEADDAPLAGEDLAEGSPASPASASPSNGASDSSPAAPGATSKPPPSGASRRGKPPLPPSSSLTAGTSSAAAFSAMATNSSAASGHRSSDSLGGDSLGGDSLVFLPLSPEAEAGAEAEEEEPLVGDSLVFPPTDGEADEAAAAESSPTSAAAAAATAAEFQKKGPAPPQADEPAASTTPSASPVLAPVATPTKDASLAEPIPMARPRSSPTNLNARVTLAPESPVQIPGARTPSPPTTHPGRRTISLRLLEELPPPSASSSSLSSSSSSLAASTPFKSLRRFRSLSLSSRAMSNFASGASSEPAALPAAPGTAPIKSRKALTADANISTGSSTTTLNKNPTTTDRGTISVSWYDGTTSKDMVEHVFRCVRRQLEKVHEIEGEGKLKLDEVRLLDVDADGNSLGEVVLCPYLPDGASFVLKFKTSIERPPPAPKISQRFKNPYSGPAYVSSAPDSPSAEPSPHPSNGNLPSLDLNSGLPNRSAQQQQQQQQMQTQQVLNLVSALLQQQQQQQNRRGQQSTLSLAAAAAAAASQLNGGPDGLPHLPLMEPEEASTADALSTPRAGKEAGDSPVATTNAGAAAQTLSPTKKAAGGMLPAMEPIDEHATTDDLIERQLRQLNELFVHRRSFGGDAPSGSATPIGPAEDGSDGAIDGSANDGQRRQPFKEDDRERAWHREEKKQVIFVIANYLVLFMGFVALSAEIQSRLPLWMDGLRDNYDSVQNCATDRDALMECLSNGDFSGLVASFLLWATQSVVAKRIFLFGFDTPKKLWTVVYEALVTAVCWGISYMFIRRGLNPNTRQNFVHKYWKDAVYGSLAGFNAAFMKAVLKNLVPQDLALEALEGRQLRIFHWLGSLMADE